MKISHHVSLWTVVVSMLAVTGFASAVTVRFEAESTGAVKDQGDAVGYDSLNGVVGRAADATASNGELLFTGGNNRNFKLIFVGTGVDLISRQDTDGGDFDWILDEGAQSGSGTTFGPSRVDQAVFPLVSGLPHTLHTLELRRKSTGILRPDAFEVHNAGSQTRYEQNDPAISYSPNWLSTNWIFDDAAAEASGGSMAVSIVRGSTATLTFSGTAVALLADVRGDGGIFGFDIDQGAVTGVIDLRAQNPLFFGNWHRWPILLSNTLPPGTHTLVLTALEANSGGRGAVNFDAIDVFGIPEPSSVALFGIVLVATCAIRRRGSVSRR
jgi:hypothetical protein